VESTQSQSAGGPAGREPGGKRPSRQRMLGAGAGAVAVLAAGAVILGVAASASASPTHHLTRGAGPGRQLGTGPGSGSSGPGGSGASGASGASGSSGTSGSSGSAGAAGGHVYGAVIPSGIKDPQGDVVFYGIRLHGIGAPFGIMEGLQKPSGRLVGEVETNEFQGSDFAPGFHGVEGAVELGRARVAMPEFGYYAGPAAKITGVVNGTTVQAGQARWSVNPRIVIFWFPAGANASGLTAYNAAGQQLAGGDSSPHAG